MKRAILLLGLCIVAAGGAGATCISNAHSYTTRAGKVSINTTTSMGDAASSAAAMWNECGGLPNIVANDNQGAIPISVTYHTGSSPSGNCGEGVANVNSTAVIGGTIDIWEKWGPNMPEHVRNQPCEPFGNLIAHEVGHVLGLSNAPDTATCNSGYIMGGGWQTVTSPDSAECANVNQKWVTPQEAQETCNLQCNQACTATTSGTGWACPDQPNPPGGDSPGDPSCTHGCSPLVLDLNGDGIHTTSASIDPIRFDLTGDGRPDLVGWTDPATEEGLLYYDHNQNHVIDGGAELFGEVTILPDGRRARNGFEALAAHDAPSQGGNGDRVISPADRVWGRLRLWVDRNHDGAMTNDENYSLGQARVVQLDLDYEQATAAEEYGLDSAGNYHFYRGTFVQRISGGERESVRALHDVYFAVRPWPEVNQMMERLSFNSNPRFRRR